MSEKDEFRDRIFKATPDINQVFLRQIDRVNQSAGTPMYPECVQQLGNLLPTEWRQWVEENEDRYYSEKPTLFFRKNCGVRIGTQQNPVLFDEEQPVKRLDDGKIDWGDPNIMSPILKTDPKTSYIDMFATIMDAAELAGLIWPKKGSRRGG